MVAMPQDTQQDADTDDADAGLQADALAEALPEGGDVAILREGLDVAAGRWPLPRCSHCTLYSSCQV